MGMSYHEHMVHNRLVLTSYQPRHETYVRDKPPVVPPTPEERAKARASTAAWYVREELRNLKPRPKAKGQRSYDYQLQEEWRAARRAELGLPDDYEPDDYVIENGRAVKTEQGGN